MVRPISKEARRWAPGLKALACLQDHCDAGGAAAAAAMAEDEAEAEEAAAAPAEDCATAAAFSAAAAEDSADEAAEADSFFLQPVTPMAATAVKASTRPTVFFMSRLPRSIE